MRALTWETRKNIHGEFGGDAEILSSGCALQKSNLDEIMAKRKPSLKETPKSHIFSLVQAVQETDERPKTEPFGLHVKWLWVAENWHST